MALNRKLVILILFFGCGRAKPEPSPSPATAAQKITFQEVEDRLPAFIQDGFVHSLAGTNPINQGDGLFYTSLLAYGADCQIGGDASQALAAMIKATNGAIYRDPSMSSVASLDGALALYRGIAKRANKCGEKDLWAPLVAMHVAYMNAHGDALNVDNSRLSGGFDYVRDLLAYNLGVGSEPGFTRQATIEDLVVTTWTAADIKAKAACYRAHLSLLTLQTIEELGGTVSATARNGFCSATNGAGLVTADHWCGRGDLSAWLDDFKYDVWQYQPQRCPGWETPDGKAGGATSQPGIDYVVAYEDLTQ